MSTPGFDYQELLVFFGLGPDDRPGHGLQTVVAVYTCFQTGTHKLGSAYLRRHVRTPDFMLFQQHVQELRAQAESADDHEETADQRLASIPKRDHLEKLKSALAAEINRIDDQLAGLQDRPGDG